jgi:hypothetical protein
MAKTLGYVTVREAAHTMGWTLTKERLMTEGGKAVGEHIFTKGARTLEIRYAGAGHPTAALAGYPNGDRASLIRKGLLLNVLSYFEQH